MKKISLETGVGVFMVIGFLCFAWISVRLGDVNLFAKDTYRVSARFTSVTGLKTGATVEIAGVTVGKVDSIDLHQEDYEAIVHMKINRGVKIQEDTIASIRTTGIIGDRFVKLSPGGLDETIEEGGEILETEGAISLEELISKYIFEGK
jgi:phospholipid/cholesterol/gamma-HCH transport system substrate-binding protein